MTEFIKERFDQVLKSNGIYDSEILSVCGYKKDSGFLDNPDQEQIKHMQKFFEKKCPLLNFNYITGKSSSPNKLISLSDVKHYMNIKHIGINQINSYIKEELGEDNAFYKILNGLYPKKKEEADEIMHYLMDIVDEKGDFQYTHTACLEHKEAKRKTTGFHRSRNQKYKLYPDKFRENKIDLKTLIQLCRSHEYSIQGFQDMVYPGSTRSTVNKLLDGTLVSIPIHMVEGIQAALDTDIWYLEGTHKPGKGNKSQKHYFPKDEHKNFKFTTQFLENTDVSVFKILARNAGIDYKLFTRARDGENIYFVGTCIKRMFNKQIYDKLKISDINDILISTDGSSLSLGNFVSAGRHNALIEMPTEKKETEDIIEDIVPDQDINSICNNVERVESTVDSISESINDIEEAKDDKELEQKKDNISPYLIPDIIPALIPTKKDITLKDVIEFIINCICSLDQLEKLSKLCLAVAEKNKILENMEF